MITAAAFKVLARRGYAGLTMDDVAVTAGVSKATIYRRWRSKADLLVSVIETPDGGLIVVPDTGSLREDLIGLFTSLVEMLTGPSGRAVRAIIAARDSDPALEAAYRRGPVDRWAESVLAIMERAIARGELTPAGMVSLGAEAGSAIFLQRWLVSGAEINAELAVAVVDEVMLPLMRAYQR